MKYNRWSEWSHLDLLKASEEILSEYPRNGCSLNCVLAARKLSCSYYCWNELMTWGWSPRRNKLKIWNPPMLTNLGKTQKPYQKWMTPEKHPLGELCWPPRLCAEDEWKLLNSWNLNSNILQKSQTGTPPRWTTSSLSVTAQSLWMLGSATNPNPKPCHKMLKK